MPTANIECAIYIPASQRWRTAQIEPFSPAPSAVLYSESILLLRPDAFGAGLCGRAKLQHVERRLRVSDI